MRNWRSALAVLTVLAAGGAAGAMILVEADRSSAEAALLACAELAERPARTACYERKVAAIVDSGGPEAAVAAFEAGIGDSAQLARDCHLALHPVGESVGKAAVAAGEAVRLVEPTSFCHEGLVHGTQIAMLAGAQTRWLVTRGGEICASTSVSASWSCLHSLGHAYRSRAADAGMADATRMCVAAANAHLGTGWQLPLGHDTFLASCVKGALMEEALRDPAVTPETACQGVRGDAAVFCHAFVPMIAAFQGVPVPDQWRACSAVPAASKAHCIRVWARQISDPAQCEPLPAGDLQKLCRRETHVSGLYESTRLKHGI